MDTQVVIFGDADLDMRWTEIERKLRAIPEQVAGKIASTNSTAEVGRLLEEALAPIIAEYGEFENHVRTRFATEH